MIILIKLVGKASWLASDFDVLVGVRAYVQWHGAYVLILNALFFGDQHHILYIFFKKIFPLYFILKFVMSLITSNNYIADCFC